MAFWTRFSRRGNAAKAFLIIALWSSPLSHGRVSAVESPKHPNILFILSEDLGYGDLACYGHPYAKTPNLDRLASEGTRFKRFYVAGMTCAPSRGGFMTGRHPASFPNKVDDWGYQGVDTVTDLLHRAGYKTGHFGKWHIGPNETSGIYGIDEVDVIGGNFRKPLGKDMMLFEAAGEFITANKDSDQPWYCNIWTHVAHSPVIAPQMAIDIFSDVKVDRSDFDLYMQEKFDEALDIGGDLDEGMRNYLADIYLMDLQIGMILEKLTETGQIDNTVIIYSSDHGAAPIMPGYQAYPQNMMGYSGGLKGAKHDFYEGGVRTPFIVRYPKKVPAGKVNNKSVISALDYLPTICSIAGAQLDPIMFEGEDISDILFGSDRSRTNPIFWRVSVPEADKVMLYGQWKLKIGGKKRRRKKDDIANRNNGRNEDELYNLEMNPTEDNNVYDLHPVIVSAMTKQLMMWDDSLPKDYRSFRDTEPLPFDPSVPPVIVGPPELLVIEEHAELALVMGEQADFSSISSIQPTKRPSPTVSPTSSPGIQTTSSSGIQTTSSSGTSIVTTSPQSNIPTTPSPFHETFLTSKPVIMPTLSPLNQDVWDTYAGSISTMTSASSCYTLHWVATASIVWASMHVLLC